MKSLAIPIFLTFKCYYYFFFFFPVDFKLMETALLDGRRHKPEMAGVFFPSAFRSRSAKAFCTAEEKIFPEAQVNI